MQYMKVKWIHDFMDEPIWIYGELNDFMDEIRKIEVFKDGSFGYASSDGISHISFPSEVKWSTKDDIESDQQFRVFLIDKQEFEEVWARASNCKKI